MRPHAFGSSAHDLYPLRNTNLSRKRLWRNKSYMSSRIRVHGRSARTTSGFHTFGHHLERVYSDEAYRLASVLRAQVVGMKSIPDHHRQITSHWLHWMLSRSAFVRVTFDKTAISTMQALPPKRRCRTSIGFPPHPVWSRRRTRPPGRSVSPHDHAAMWTTPDYDQPSSCSLPS